MTLAIRLDAVGGIAGDMFAAAMVDALPDLRARVLADAAAVLPPGTGTPVFTPGTSAGLHCLRFGLSAPLGVYHHHDHRHPCHVPPGCTPRPATEVTDRAPGERNTDAARRASAAAIDLLEFGGGNG